MRQIYAEIAAAVMLASAAGIAAGSSPDAWQTFRDDVRMKCEDQFRKVLVNPHVVLDPIGVSSVGIAIGTGKSKQSADKVLFVCIYDKKTEKVELGSEINLRDMPACR